MNQYEVLYVITPELDEEADKVVMDKFADIITANGGEIEKTEVWGKRRLAYPINDLVEGYYVYMTCETRPDMPAELDRVFKITEGIMRSMIICKDE